MKPKMPKIELSPESLALAEVRSFIEENKSYANGIRDTMIDQLAKDHKFTGEYQAHMLADIKRMVIAAQYIENWLTQGLDLAEIKKRIFQCFIDHSIGRHNLSDRIDVYGRLAERLKL